MTESIRPLTKSDDPAIPFVVSSWLRSYEETALNQLGADGSQRNVVVTMLRKQILGLLKTSTVRVAYLDEDHDTFVGWVCGEPATQTIHYVYVKDAWRRGGLAKRLARELVKADSGRFTFATHKHNHFMRAVERAGWRWRLLTP